MPDQGTPQAEVNAAAKALIKAGLLNNAGYIDGDEIHAAKVAVEAAAAVRHGAASREVTLLASDLPRAAFNAALYAVWGLAPKDWGEDEAIARNIARAAAPAIRADERQRIAVAQQEPRRLQLGRLSVYVEPRDAWIGMYVAAKAIYLCPLPFIVIRWERQP